MTAKEMFEELGYKIQPIKEDRIAFVRRYKKDDFNIITFYNDKYNNKRIMKSGEHDYYCDYIRLEELQAINKQIEELGWK